MTIISNLSPYAKTLSLISSIKLMSMFEHFSSRWFLFAAQENPSCLNFLLDTFNNLIQYQYEGNQHVIYTLCCNKKVFDQLVNMKFEENSSKKNREQFNGDKEKENESNNSSNENKTDSEEAKATTTNYSFVPSEEWFNKWKTDLHISTVMRLLDYLLPQIEGFCKRQNQASVGEKAIMQFLKNTTLVGLLPVPHAIVIRKYEPNQYTTLWFTTYIWGVFFLRNKKYPLWESDKIRLFSINLV
mmetsp:Transcript_16603/g.18783  ORF Transcript_16603/g.18783 Transcript_16603/m.18783 type:complete len:243 (+) Transcript_16603:3-731(+)